MFDARVMTKARTLMLQGGVEVALNGPSIDATVQHEGERRSATITPLKFGDRVAFSNSCSCGQRSCVHQAAGAMAALEKFPVLRRHAQPTFLDKLAGAASTSAVAPAAEARKLVFELSPADPPLACYVGAFLVGERSGGKEATTLERILATRNSGESARMMARLLSGADVGGGEGRVAVAPGSVASVLGLLARLGSAQWHATGVTLSLGVDRAFPANVPPDLPPESAIILGATGPWYVDAASGAMGRVRVLKVVPPEPPPAVVVAPVRPRTGARGGPQPSRLAVAPAAEPVILDGSFSPVLQLRRIEAPDSGGRMQMTDTLMVSFDYGGALVPFDDDRQFVRAPRPSDPPNQPSFFRRDRAGEAEAMELLRPDGFTQMRVAENATAKGRIVLVFRGRDATERWQGFLSGRLPALKAIGWRHETDPEFGPAMGHVGVYDVRVADASPGRFSLDFGIEVDGKRVPLLPILQRLLENGGYEAAQVVDGELITSLEDGRVLKLPAERMRRLLMVTADLIESATRNADGGLVLPESEAASVLDLEEVMSTRWEDAVGIEAYAARFRDAPDLPPAAIPGTFKATLRPYQLQGVAWLQHLRSQGLSAFLADDMGLGKTAQTIAHICIEHASGRLDRPALIVVPTSLVANWTAELTKFAPHLNVVVLHGGERHARRSELEGVQVVVTTYTVLTRDIEEMIVIPWHLAVLDEAQVIKSPDSKATKAVCQLDTRFRLCLSGTPIENNLQELWSEFSFLMPALLGDRRAFAKRFRTPIEKNGDVVRRVQLIRRIKPFLLRRTKSEVATGLAAEAYDRAPGRSGAGAAGAV